MRFRFTSSPSDTPALRAELEALLPDLATGLRAALATVIPLVLAQSTARPELRWMALGGWLGTLADPGGARRTRAEVLAGFLLLGSAIVLLSALGAHSRWIALALFAAVAFSAALLRALGDAAATPGTMLAIVAALATARPTAEPGREALGFAAGAALALLLSSIVWPVWTHWPVRQAVAKVFGELAAYAQAVAGLGASGAPEGDLRWTQVARAHPRRIRAAIERAHSLSLSIHARRGAETRRGSNLRVLLGMAESQFLALVALASELEARPLARRPLGGMAEPLRALAATDELVASQLRARPFGRLEGLGAPPIDSAEVNPPPDSLDGLARRLTAEAAASLALSGALGSLGAAGRGLELAPSAVALSLDFALLRDQATWRSPLLRHALRVALASSAAAGLGAAISPDHAGWVAVTTLVVLQQAAGATVRRAGERALGTLLGCVVAVALTHWLRSPIALAAALFPLSIAAVVTRPRSYRLFTFFLTPVFVLVAMRFPGDWWIAAERVGDTALGGAIAFVAAVSIFPGWEERIALPDALGVMVERCLAYAAAVERLLAHPTADRVPLLEARRTAALAIDAAESSLERVLAEPLRAVLPQARQAARAGTSAREARQLETVTFARRLVLSTTTLDILATQHADPAALDAARTRLTRFRELLARATGERESTGPRPLSA